jgi:hypothetical protein
MVEIQHAAGALSSQDTAAYDGVGVRARNELVAKRLMIAFGVIVSSELPDGHALGRVLPAFALGTPNPTWRASQGSSTTRPCALGPRFRASRPLPRSTTLNPKGLCFTYAAERVDGQPQSNPQAHRDRQEHAALRTVPHHAQQPDADTRTVLDVDAAVVQDLFAHPAFSRFDCPWRLIDCETSMCSLASYLNRSCGWYARSSR